MNLGESIYKYRTERSMSQGDLADALEVSRQSVSKWENNSAVPELDKLIKMAMIFGITLDELVTGAEKKAPEPASAPAPVPAPAPAPANKEAKDPEPFPVGKIIGIVCLCGGLLCTMICIILAILLGNHYAGDLVAAAVLIGLPMTVTGVCCLCLQYPQLFCGWAAWAGYLVYVFVMTSRWEEETLLILLAALGLVAMLVWTVRAQRSGRVQLPKWLLILGGTAVALLVILFLINTMPPLELVGDGAVSTVVPAERP